MGVAIAAVVVRTLGVVESLELFDLLERKPTKQPEIGVGARAVSAFSTPPVASLWDDSMFTLTELIVDEASGKAAFWLLPRGTGAIAYSHD